VKKRLSVISLMIGLLCLFSSMGVVLADPVQVGTTYVIEGVIVLGILVFVLALAGWLVLRGLHQQRKER
jgi:hypothetical protein